jgi:2-polyprenyl-6-methoxyphenol hydroxylase-like FAD-dependent oxidoreductase
MNELNPNARILIVGAGPTGLTSAAFLHRQSIAFDLIDPRFAPVTDSRALGVHARTLEFMAMLGLDQQFVAQGHKTRFMTFHRGGKKLFKLDFSRIKDLTRYPYMLVLPQSNSETILVDHLQSQGKSVTWGSTLTGLHQTEEVAHADIQLPDGRSVHKTYDYVIGCDGANSFVRNAVDIPFEGQTYDARFLLSEVQIDNDAIDRTSSHVFMGKKTTVAVIPQPGDIYRVVGPDFAVSNGGPELVKRKDVSFADFSDFMKANDLLQHVTMRRPSRMVSYRVHKRVAAQFRKGRIFIAGDAAHVHSPAGGQGMNTGLHDVVNLSWRLAQVLHHKADPSILDAFEKERRHAALIIVNGADAAMMRVVSRKFMSRVFFDLIAPVVTRIYQPKRLLASIAQVRWTYDGLDKNQGIAAVGGFAVGSRIADLTLSNDTRLFSVLGTHEDVAVISTSNPDGYDLDAVRQIAGSARVAVLAKPLRRAWGPPLECVLHCRPDGFITHIARLCSAPEPRAADLPDAAPTLP